VISGFIPELVKDKAQHQQDDDTDDGLDRLLRIAFAESRTRCGVGRLAGDGFAGMIDRIGLGLLRHLLLPEFFLDGD